MGGAQAPAGLGIVRVLLERLLEREDGLLESVARVHPQVLETLEVVVVRLEVVGPPPQHSQPFLGYARVILRCSMIAAVTSSWIANTSLSSRS